MGGGALSGDVMSKLKPVHQQAVLFREIHDPPWQDKVVATATAEPPEQGGQEGLCVNAVDTSPTDLNEGAKWDGEGAKEGSGAIGGGGQGDDDMVQLLKVKAEERVEL